MLDATNYTPTEYDTNPAEHAPASADFVIYKHTAPNGKAYIGQTSNYEYRCKQHQSRSGCRAFANAIKKYGWHAFKHEILETGLTLVQANQRESFYIEAHKTIKPHGYNLKGGGGNAYLSEETKSIIKATLARPEVKAKISAGMKAAHARPEVKEKRKEVFSRPEVKAKVSAASKAAHAQPEIKAKLSAASKAAHARPEVKAKISAASKASNARPEVKEKISAGMKAAHARPEVKEKRKEVFSRPEVKAKVSAAYARPEVKEKMSSAAIKNNKLRKEKRIALEMQNAAAWNSSVMVSERKAAPILIASMQLGLF
jgi:group I intron endonuclease